MNDQERSIVLYLHVHQPWRVKKYSIFDTTIDHQYFTDAQNANENNETVFHKVAEKSYLPMNALLQQLLDDHPEFRISLSITGTFIEQAEAYSPEVLDSFKRLVATGRVEIVAETYYHSLAFFFDREEFEAQVAAHAKKIYEVFGVKMTAFRNTELAYNDQLGQWADQQGYSTILAEGWDNTLGWRSPNYVYHPPETTNIRLLLKNYRLSDDLAFRFSNQAWQEWPLTVDKYSQWLADASRDTPLVNLFMDYETFGEHQWEDTGIFTFFKDFVTRWIRQPHHTFKTVTQAATSQPSVDEVSMPQTVTWADTERDLTAWLGNDLQQEAMRYIYGLADDVMRSGNLELISDWRRLQTSDHAYYMCTKWFRDGDVHAYFSPYESPYDAFLYYMNVIRDMRWRLSHYYSFGAL